MSAIFVFINLVPEQICTYQMIYWFTSIFQVHLQSHLGVVKGTVSRRCSWQQLWVYLVLVFVILSCLCHAALWSADRKGLTSWIPSMLCFLVYLSRSHTVSWVRCGT